MLRLILESRTLVIISLLLATLSVFEAHAASYPSDPVSIASGLELAEVHCASCHAIGFSDSSRQAGAPAFRELSKRYRLENLEESLAEGIVTGHVGMPEFVFEPEDIDVFLGYLTSIQLK